MRYIHISWVVWGLGWKNGKQSIKIRGHFHPYLSCIFQVYLLKLRTILATPCVCRKMQHYDSTTRTALHRFNQGLSYQWHCRQPRPLSSFLGKPPSEHTKTMNWFDHLLKKRASALLQETLLPECLYIAWDIETTGLSKKSVDITEFACCGAVWRRGRWITATNAPWQSYCHTKQYINETVRKLTGIKPETLIFAPSMHNVVKMLKTCVIEWKQEFGVQNVVFVAHNGDLFDIPCLDYNLHRHCGLCISQLFRELGVIGTMDSLKLCKNMIWKTTKRTRRTKMRRQSLKLSDLYYYISGTEMVNSHTAAADASAMFVVMSYILRHVGAKAWKRKITPRFLKCTLPKENN